MDFPDPFFCLGSWCTPLRIEAKLDELLRAGDDEEGGGRAGGKRTGRGKNTAAGGGSYMPSVGIPMNYAPDISSNLGINALFGRTGEDDDD